MHSDFGVFYNIMDPSQEFWKENINAPSPMNLILKGSDNFILYFLRLRFDGQIFLSFQICT